MKIIKIVIERVIERTVDRPVDRIVYRDRQLPSPTPAGEEIGCGGIIAIAALITAVGFGGYIVWLVLRSVSDVAYQW